MNLDSPEKGEKGGYKDDNTLSRVLADNLYFWNSGVFSSFSQSTVLPSLLMQLKNNSIIQRKRNSMKFQ